MSVTVLDRELSMTMSTPYIVKDDENSTSSTPYINRIIRSCCLSFVSLLIIVGNAVCLMVLRRAQAIGIKGTTKIFLMSLTCADLAQGFFGAIPVTISAGLGFFPKSGKLCFYQALLSYILSFISCLSLFAVTAERYITILYPLRYPMIVTMRRAKIAIAALWTFQSLLTILLAIVLQMIIPESGISSFNQGYLMCFPLKRDNKQYGHSYVILIFLFIPTISIIFMYTKMLLVARYHTITRMTKSGNTLTQATFRSKMASEHRAVVTFLTITSASVIAWLPFTVVTFVDFNLHRDVQPYWRFLSIVFLFSGSWFNVVIYYLRNPKFRSAAKRIMLL